MKNVKIQKRKVLNELIHEIVNEQVEMMLLEYADSGGGALYSVFIQPFVDTGNVIKAEIGKIGANVIGNTAQGLLGAFSVLLPMLNKIPFTEKTWKQGIDAIKNKTRESISKIDKKYGNSYNAVNRSFTNPDLAFLAFSFNPGLYLGSVLGAQSVGAALTLGQSMLGTSGNLTTSYYNFLNTLGIFSPQLKPQSGGVTIDVGMGGYGDGAGAFEENRNFKNYVSMLVEKEMYNLCQLKKILKEEINSSTTSSGMPNKQTQKTPETLLDDVVTFMKNSHNCILDETSKNSILDQIKKIGVDIYEKTIFEKLKNAKLENIVDLTSFIKKINTSDMGIKLANAGTENFVSAAIDLRTKGTKPYPETIDDFIKAYDSNEIDKNEARKILSSLGIKIDGSLQKTFDNLPDEEKTNLRDGYKTMSEEKNKSKKAIPEAMITGIERSLGGTINGIPIVDEKNIANITDQLLNGSTKPANNE